MKILGQISFAPELNFLFMEQPYIKYKHFAIFDTLPHMIADVI